MNFVKFVDLLERSSLWFSRADKLSDPREGDLTEAELCKFREAPSPEIAERNLGIFRSLRLENFLNCWTVASESMAMWDLYAHSPGGVAVKSTIGGLKRAIRDETERIFLSQVEYIDWNTGVFPNNAIALYVRKNSGFEHEKEVRMIIWMPNSSMPTPAEIGDVVQLHNSLLPFLSQLPSEQQAVLKRILNEQWGKASFTRAREGVTVRVDLTNLIDEVIVSPQSGSHFKDLVQRMLQRYGLQDKQVRRSELSHH